MEYVMYISVSQCSASCASGVQRREVKCLNEDLEPALGCTAATKPDTRQPCNTQSCEETESRPESSQFDPNETGKKSVKIGGMQWLIIKQLQKL